MERSLYNFFLSTRMLLICVMVALHVHADQWKMHRNGNSYAPYRRSGYHTQKRRLDRGRRLVSSRAEHNVENESESRRLSSGPYDACTQWCNIYRALSSIFIVLFLHPFLFLSFFSTLISFLCSKACVTNEKINCT